MERLFVGVEIEINRSSTTTNKKSEKANHEFLHFSLFSLTLQSYTIKTAISQFYCIISPHQSQLDTNRAVRTSRSRYRAYRRHRCRRCGVREGLLLIQVVFTKKVQMKRSVTEDDADGCCPQRKSPCPTLFGRKTKALYGKTDQEGFRFNAKYTFCLIWLLCTRYELLQALQYF